jgi:hypothetical protein
MGRLSLLRIGKKQKKGVRSIPSRKKKEKIFGGNFFSFFDKFDVSIEASSLVCVCRDDDDYFDFLFLSLRVTHWQ